MSSNDRSARTLCVGARLSGCDFRGEFGNSCGVPICNSLRKLRKLQRLEAGLTGAPVWLEFDADGVSGNVRLAVASFCRGDLVRVVVSGRAWSRRSGLERTVCGVSFPD